jgi:Cu2+-containing amine oxidase
MVCRYTARTPDEQITAASAAHTFGRRVGTDYITEYKFQLDGSVRVGFDFAGYMETRWFSQEHTPFERSLSEVVHTNLAAPLHSHFGCFKVDIDASPEGESFEHTKITAGLTPTVPDLRGWATKFVERDYPATETTYMPSAASPGAWALVDKGSNTARDDATPSGKAGYGIKVGPTVGQSLPDDHPFVLASAFSKYTLAITKRKEEEQKPTSVYDLFGAPRPATLFTSSPLDDMRAPQILLQ